MGNKQICEGCGEIFEEHRMMSYNSGRKTHWYCWTCWKEGQGEAAGVEIRRKREQRKERLKHK